MLASRTSRPSWFSAARGWIRCGWWGAALIVLLISVTARRANAAPVRIQVRGTAQILVDAWSENGTLIVRGELGDDAGAPIALAPLVVSGLDTQGKPIPLGSASACEGASRNRGDGVLVTDERGTFCARYTSPAKTVNVKYSGSDLYEGGEVRSQVADASGNLQPVVLRFEPDVDMVDLERETIAISGSLKLARGFQKIAEPPKREGLQITLEDERGQKLAEGVTGGDGRVRFDVASRAFADPGTGELKLRFAGTDVLARATAFDPVLRQAEARLAVGSSGNADGGDAVIDVEVTCARGGVSGGVVEALRDGTSVGTAPVQDGKARIVAGIASERATSVGLTLRYLPAAPWYRAGPPIEATIAVSGAGIWRQLALAVAVALVAIWVVAGWRRAKPKPRQEDAAPPPPSGRPGVQIVGRAPGVGGWRGVVVDAHDGTPVAGARLSIVVPAFRGDGVVVRAEADAHGAFSFDGTHTDGARLVVEADLHSTYEQALPPPSMLHVAVINRRRALLDRLVRWARGQGAPFDGSVEPTPGHVRRAAGRLEGDVDRWGPVQVWAERVEHLAFGPDPVRATDENEARRLEPPG